MRAMNLWVCGICTATALLALSPPRLPGRNVKEFLIFGGLALVNFTAWFWGRQ